MARDRSSSGIGQDRGNAVTVPDLQYLDRVHGAGQQNEITQYDEDLIENAGARYTLAVIQVVLIWGMCFLFPVERFERNIANL